MLQIRQAVEADKQAIEAMYKKEYGIMMHTVFISGI